MKSLRLRLLVIIGVSLVALWTAVAAWMLVDLRRELRSALDERLAASARMVAGLVAQLPVTAPVTPGRAGALLDVIGRDGLACEVSLLRGAVTVQTVARTAGSPGLEQLPAGYSTGVFGGKLWRTYVLEQGPVRVATADRIELREALLHDVVLAAAIPFAVALVGSLALLWFAIGGGLAPLERMRRLLAQRRPEEAGPLPATDVPRELQPLVDTIGRLLERVRGALARERRFTDDAAHELRTPLTAVKTHLQVLRLALGRSQPGTAVGEALLHADQGVMRMQRTLEQLLLLARLDGRAEGDPQARCDAAAAACHAIQEAELAHGCQGSVRLEAPGAPVSVAAPESLVASAVRNLLDNALRMAPAGRFPQVRIEPAADGMVRLTVLDDGPGMTRDECAQAVQRFWRRGPSGTGSGLGLAIVRGIAERFGGSLELAPRPEGGLRAQLALPPATDAAASGA